MKLRLAVALALLASAVICAVCSYCYLEREGRTLISQIEAALDAEGKDLAQKADAISARWTACEPLFCVLIHHDDADVLTRAFLQLKRTLPDGSAGEIRAALAECLTGLEVLMDGEALKFTNFL